MHTDTGKARMPHSTTAADAADRPRHNSAAASAFLSRVRSALHGGDVQRTDPATPPSPPIINESLVRLCDRHDDLAARFTTGATAVGMNVHQTSESELAALLVTLIGQHASEPHSTVAVSIADHVLAGVVESALQTSGRHICEWRGTASLDSQFDAAIGITDVDAGLAETGTIIVRSDAVRSRGAFLVPPVHIAILRTAQLLPDMLDFWSAFRGPPPTSLVFITGPSKTADIEGILITGVHGPKAVHVILVKE